MIKQLTLTNWKSFSQATLYIDPLGVLIGTNASGKSNVLDAFLFLYLIIKGISLTDALAGDVSLPGIRGGLEWVILKGRKQFSLSMVISDSESNITDFVYTVSASVNGTKCEIIDESLKRQKYRKASRDGKPSEIFLFKTDECQDDSPSITARLYNKKKVFHAPRIVPTPS